MSPSIMPVLIESINFIKSDKLLRAADCFKDKHARHLDCSG